MLEVQEIEEVVNKHMPMIYKNIRKYNIGNHENLEDIVADARLCLIKRAQTYDPTKGAFQTHSFLYLRNAMLKSIANASSTFNFNDIKIFNMYRSGITDKGKEHAKIETTSLSALCNPHRADANNPQNVGDTVAIYDQNLDNLFDNVPNLLSKCLSPDEHELANLLYYTQKERKHIYLKLDQKIINLITKLTGKKKKTISTNDKRAWKHKLTTKVYQYYKTNGYPDARKPI